MAAQLSRPDCLSSQLSELTEYWLDIRCSCGLSVYYPCRLMAKERGGALRLSDVLPRLRCRHCKARPERVLVTDDPSGGSPVAVAWKLVISP
ncbi:MAG: hypothetical protein M3O36_18805 [Myxococcota bacterium]|nr:hypothetical protein [Myxococcota bacterium]